jgi:hypothetical protein
MSLVSEFQVPWGRRVLPAPLTSHFIYYTEFKCTECPSRHPLLSLVRNSDSWTGGSLPSSHSLKKKKGEVRLKPSSCALGSCEVEAGWRSLGISVNCTFSGLSEDLRGPYKPRGIVLPSNLQHRQSLVTTSCVSNGKAFFRLNQPAGRVANTATCCTANWP